MSAKERDEYMEKYFEMRNKDYYLSRYVKRAKIVLINGKDVHNCLSISINVRKSINYIIISIF